MYKKNLKYEIQETRKVYIFIFYIIYNKFILINMIIFYIIYFFLLISIIILIKINK